MLMWSVIKTYLNLVHDLEWRQSGIFRQGADSSDEGAKIRLSGYCKCQKSPTNSFSPSYGGLA